MEKPVLYIVIPCYNEQEVLPVTSGMFLEKVKGLAAAGKVSEKSRVMFVNDGSKDNTWAIIQQLAAQDEPLFSGVCLSRNRGHQNALLAGLMTGQGHGGRGHLDGLRIGRTTSTPWTKWWTNTLPGATWCTACARKRETDTLFKRTTAEGFYNGDERAGRKHGV